MTDRCTTHDRLETLTRRRVIAAGAGTAASLSFPALAQARGTIKIGYITALSGVRANFGEADQWTLDKFRAAVKNGVSVGGKTYSIEVVLKDNQSDPNRSQTVSSEAVLRDKVDLVLVQDGDAAGPAGQLCDVHGIPMISTMMPWQAFTFGRGSTPDKGFPYSFHFFWGADDVLKNFFGIWNGQKTNKVLGTFYIDNPPGQAFADPNTGLPGGAKGNGYKEINTGFFKIATNDFSTQVSAMKAGGAQIVSGFAFANHFATFWKQAQQAGFKPELVTMAGPFLFPSAVQSMGDAGDGMGTEIWWTPNFPFKSSITGQSAKELAAEWEKSTGKQWTQPIGYGHALWETALAAIKGAADPKSRKALRDAIAGMKLDSIVGSINFKESPIKSIAVTPMVSGQWRKSKGGKFPYDLLITHNGTAPMIPVEADYKPMSALK
ncbi:MAG: branched-chain amino acid ABC transporter substrate-binding protein [Rubrivivax sp. SCN 71-131]|jgi:branched-chain amino acid transport system substrate-binding protein|nr:MAG: branched-chain amino acid ABC transporter substrate-binding protein [Rubrivivax sp. SCN 71-131]